MTQYNAEAGEMAFKVRCLYDDLVGNSDNIDASLFSDDFTWQPSESSRIYKNETIAGLKNFLTNAFWNQPAWDQFNFRIDEIHAGDRIVMQGYYTGIYKPTGKVLCAQMLHIWSIDNGKITGLQELTDTQEFFAVMSD